MKRWLKTYLFDIAIIIFLTLVVFIYFLKLFYPKPAVFITPDIALSDVLNLNYSLKDFLSESLKNHEFPLWAKNLQNGFPVLGEGQIGALNFLNLTLFYFLPTWLAFNLTYIFSFLTAGIFMYLYLRYINLSRSSSLFGAIAFAFSGPLVFQISHTNLLQAASMLPLIFLLTEHLLRKPGFFASFLLSFFLTQQFLFGFPQTTFLTIIAISLYVLFFWIITFIGKNRRKINFNEKILRPQKNCVIFFVLAIILFLLFSAVQILPTLEYTKYSTRRFGLEPEDVLYHSFSPEMLLTLFNPYIFGSPKEGNFPFRFFTDGVLFWEEVAYFGLIPLVFLFFFFLKIKKMRLWQEKFFIILSVVSFFLMLGKHSPFYFIFSFTFFSNFRFVCRFVLLFVFSLTILSAFGLEKFLEKIKKGRLRLFIPFLIPFVIIITILDLFLISYSYHPIEPVKELLNPPKTAKFLLKREGRIFTLGGDVVWKQNFLKEGFNNISLYKYFRNDLSPDINLLYKIPSARGFLGSNYFLLRKILIEKAIINNIDIKNSKEGQLKIPKSSINLLRIYGVDYLLSPFYLDSKELKLVFETKKYKNQKTYKIYRLKGSLPRIFSPDNFLVRETYEETLEELTKENFNPQETVLLSKDPRGAINNEPNEGNPWYQVLEDKNQILRVNIKTQKSRILVFNNTYYPGWEAFLDKKPLKILPANIVAQAVIIPKGDHLLEFRYKPKSFYLGLKISFLSFSFTIFLLALQSFFSFLHKFLNKNWL